MKVPEHILSEFAQVQCDGSLHVHDLSNGAEVAVRADEPVVMASVFKTIVALEFHAQAETGEVDPGAQIEVTAKKTSSISAGSWMPSASSL